jgi:hypothetical protein
MKTRFSPATFLRNLKWAFKVNEMEELRDLWRAMEKVARDVRTLNPEAAAFQALRLYHDVLESENNQFRDEIDYCRQMGQLSIFPYAPVKPFPNVEVHEDRRKGLPYLLHEGKRLYYPASWNKGRITGSYLQCTAVEGILGGGCLAKSPHCYVSGSFGMRDGDVVADLGAAEGLFALHMAERAEKLYVCECDAMWRDALKATFEPFADKAVLLEKAVGNADGPATVRLDNLLAAERGKRLVIKMDVEGAEYQTLKAASRWLAGEKAVALLCAAYHRQEDAGRLRRLVSEWGYETEFSEGYMLFLYDRLTPPYFRHGVLRAWTPGFCEA